jgi:hypothetical protein
LVCFLSKGLFGWWWLIFGSWSSFQVCFIEKSI